METVSLPADQFATVLRWAKTSSLEQVRQLDEIVTGGMIRLGLRANRRKAVRGIPDGSDQFEPGSVRDWLKRIQPGDAEAEAQVVAIHATIKARLE